MPEAAAAAPPRVVVIAEDPLARSGLGLLLSGDPRLNLVDQLAPRDDLAAVLTSILADVAVWDLGANVAGLERAGAVGDSMPLVCLLPDGDRAAEDRKSVV